LKDCGGGDAFDAPAYGGQLRVAFEVTLWPVAHVMCDAVYFD
jgi:hypothetical protein